MKKILSILVFCVLFFPLTLFSKKRDTTNSQESKPSNKFLYGAGFDIGVFHPSAFYDYVNLMAVL